MSNPAPRLVIYTRRDCSLCEQMEAGVRQALGPAVRLAMVEIDDDPALVKRFGPDVPVLCLDDEVVCKHFLDAERLQGAIFGSQDDGPPASV
ncbi:MAG: glutaredoxin family protein [Gammaproteobacteria bacterium]